MKNQWKILLCLVLAVLAVLGTGCDKTDVPGEDTGDSTVVTPVVQDLSVVSDGQSSYSVIVQEGVSRTIIDASRSIIEAVQEKTGVRLGWTDDFLDDGAVAPETEILIGRTNRAESMQVLRDVRYGEYAIRAVGQKIVIAGWDTESLAAGCKAFAALAAQDAGDGTWSLLADYSAREVCYDPFLTLPHYGSMDEDVNFVDLGDGAHMLYVKRTDAQEFDAYRTALENAGYTEFANRRYGDNLHAIYTSGENVIHATYAAKEKAARIAIENAYDMSIFTEQPYETVCVPSVTMIGQENYAKDDNGFYYQKGMSLIFLLEDGRFIIVDGGGHNKTSLNSLYTTLQDLAPDKDNITVAAWIITHAHSDHVGTFLKFTEAGYHKSIRVENIIHHLVSADEDRTLQTREAFAAEYTNTNIIKAHTGQKIYAGGAEIEMLFTFADLMPSAVDDLNATSVMFRVTVQGKTVMILGDSTTYTSGHLVKTYGNYLKSDIVQVAHHGKTGGTVALYEKIDADVLLWPGGVANFNGDGSLDCLRTRDYNVKALELAEEAYIAGANIFTLIMPYTPEDGETTRIIY